MPAHSHSCMPSSSIHREGYRPSTPAEAHGTRQDRAQAAPKWITRKFLWASTNYDDYCSYLAWAGCQAARLPTLYTWRRRQGTGSETCR
jgi:hypothetical protein